MIEELTPGDKQSQAWRKLVIRWKARLEELRGQNDGPKSSEETANLRGRIAEIKGMLDLNTDQPIVEKPVYVKF